MDKPKIIKLHCQNPYEIKKRILVEMIPKKAKIDKKSFFLPDKSAIAPNKGAIKTITSPATELAVPSKAVDVTSLRSPAQYDLKKRGKKPAKTVVAKTELAQS